MSHESRRMVSNRGSYASDIKTYSAVTSLELDTPEQR